jgi:hypothetical protein
MAIVLFPIASVAVLVLTAAGVAWRARNKQWVHDAQLALNARPRLNLIPAVFLLLGAVALVIFGIASIAIGFTAGWGFFALALEALTIVGFTAWIARRPL